MRIFLPVISILILFLASGCASMKPADFEKGTASGDPVQFFAGHTRSSGVVENRGGKPTVRITTETTGIWKDSVLVIEQDLYPEGSKKNHRSWKLRRVDEHHVEATANDIDGTAKGLLYGNTVSWAFRLKLQNRKFIRHARMSQMFYLQPGGQTMIIRSVIRKFSFIVAQITEEFQKY